MAAPHVSAMAGLVKSANPLLDAAGVKSVLIQSAECLEGNLTAPCNSNSSIGSDPQKAMRQLGYGVPKADKAVQIALGGPGAKNRLTPLFGYYNTDGDNHFYTTNPQMAIAAKRNTLQPAPRFKLSTPSITCTTSICDLTHLSSIKIYGNQTVLRPNGLECQGTECSGVEVVYERATGATLVRGSDTVNASAGGVLGTAASSLDTKLTYATFLGPNVAITGLVASTFPLTYKEIGLPIPGYPNLPCGSKFMLDATTGSPSNSACEYYPARAVAMLLTTHVDPTNTDPTNTGKVLKPVYRFSCNPDNLTCNIAAGSKAAFHVAFRYTSNETILNGIKSEGYDLDGIEGYVFDPNDPQPAGTQMLCSRRNAARHDRMLG
jgi:hypothetical protein